MWFSAPDIHRLDPKPVQENRGTEEVDDYFCHYYYEGNNSTVETSVGLVILKEK